jgi:hypothetical protein
MSDKVSDNPEAGELVVVVVVVVLRVCAESTRSSPEGSCLGRWITGSVQSTRVPDYPYSRD